MPSVDHLVRFNESTGTSASNDGTDGTAFSALGSPVEDTDFSWNQDAGSYDGYVEGISLTGKPRWEPTGATAPSSTISSLNFACRFQIHTMHGDGITGILSENDNASFGFHIWAADDGASGFDIFARWKDSVGLGAVDLTVAESLSFNTDYSLCVCADNESLGAIFVKSKVDSGSVQSTATYNLGSGSKVTTLPRLFMHADWTDRRTLDGYCYYAAMSYATVWSDTEMANINSDPQSNIDEWPGAAGGVVVAPPSTQFNRRSSGRYM